MGRVNVGSIPAPRPDLKKYVDRPDPDKLNRSTLLHSSKLADSLRCRPARGGEQVNIQEMYMRSKIEWTVNHG